MRLRVAVDLSFRGTDIGSEKGYMSDWIDKIKSQDEAQAQFSQQQAELRLHKAKLITAKGPAAWDALVGQIKADADKLNKTFPGDTSRQCDFVQRGLEYTLQNRKLPIKILGFSLNLDGQQIDMSEGSKTSREHQPQMRRESPILFKLDADEEIQYEWFGKQYSDPALLSEQFIKRVCNTKF